MTSTRSIRQGQIEIGIIEHEGREYAALGATVIRRDVTGYVKFKRNHFWLTTWAGGTTMLDCRSEVVGRYWNGGLALMFRLPRGRFIVGYVIDGDGDGSLFRGELIDHCDADEARRHCQMVADNWAEVDQMDEAAELAEV
jgi:hypothetical protein